MPQGATWEGNWQSADREKDHHACMWWFALDSQAMSQIDRSIQNKIGVLVCHSGSYLRGTQVNRPLGQGGCWSQGLLGSHLRNFHLLVTFHCYPGHALHSESDTGLRPPHRMHSWQQYHGSSFARLSTFSSVQSHRGVRLFVIPWTIARQASLSITNSQSLLKLMLVELVMPHNHLIFCCPLLFLPSIFPSIRVFSNESVLCISIRVFSNESVFCIRWPKYQSFSFSISPSNEYSGLISFRVVGSPCSPRDSQESSPTPQFKSINSLGLSFLYSPTLTSIHDYWKNHSFDQMDLCW